MFKKKCSKCNQSISKTYDFCPHCGSSASSKENKESYGLLGKNDQIESNLFESFEGTFMDKIFENAMKMAEKMIERQIASQERSSEEKPHEIVNAKTNNMEVQFFVNGKRVFPQKEEKVEEKVKTVNILSKEKAEKFSKLPRKEPSSKVRRFSGKIIYELEMPGVKKIEDVLINQLENSIEIKALSKDQVYSKTLNISLPILGYKLSEGNLILELKG